MKLGPLAISLAFAAPALAVPRAPPRPLESVAPPRVEPGIVVDGQLTAMWSDGEVGLEGAESAPPTRPIPGEVLSPPARIKAAVASRLVLLLAGDRLVELRGPGAWLFEAGRLIPEARPGVGPSPEPRVEALEAYREGPLPTLIPPLSQPILQDLSLPPALLILQPTAPVLRSDRPTIRWHWPYDGGRFDLLLERVEETGRSLGVVERWQNLAGLSHTLWAPLERGASYRVSLRYRSGSDSSPIADRQVFHVLAASEIAAVDGALASLDTLQARASRQRPEVEVLRARLLESHGLWAEAEAVWTALALRYPDNEALLQHALRLHAQGLEPDQELR